MHIITMFIMSKTSLLSYPCFCDMFVLCKSINSIFIIADGDFNIFPLFLGPLRLPGRLVAMAARRRYGDQCPEMLAMTSSAGRNRDET